MKRENGLLEASRRKLLQATIKIHLLNIQHINKTKKDSIPES